MKKMISLLILLALNSGCVTQQVAPDPATLRVGIAANSKPMAFKEGGEIIGIEADFAKKLGKELNREIIFVEVSWDKLIESVEQNKIDIIMSNMTVTAPRSMRINFSTPYMQSGLSGLFRRSNTESFGLAGNITVNQNKRIGFIKNTTSEYFCVQRFSHGKLVGYAKAANAVAALKNNKIDMFIHDAPMVWWQSALNERELVAFPETLNVEPLAWGISKQNMDLLDEVNAQIALWEKDGTSQKIIQNWIQNVGK